MNCLHCGADTVDDEVMCRAEACVLAYQQMQAQGGVGFEALKRWEVAARLFRQVAEASDQDYGMTLVVHPNQHVVGKNQVAFASTLPGQSGPRRVFLDCVFRSLIMEGKTRSQFVDELNEHVLVALQRTMTEPTPRAYEQREAYQRREDGEFTVQSSDQAAYHENVTTLDRVAETLCVNFNADYLFLLAGGGPGEGFSVQVSGVTDGEVIENLKSLEEDLVTILGDVREMQRTVQQKANAASA